MKIISGVSKENESNTISWKVTDIIIVTLAILIPGWEIYSTLSEYLQSGCIHMPHTGRGVPIEPICNSPMTVGIVIFIWAIFGISLVWNVSKKYFRKK